MTGIPTELRGLDQWVLWRAEERNGKPTKIPRQRNGRNASSTDRRTWDSFKTVQGARGFDGIGLVVTKDDPYTAFDLDHCRDAESGEIDPWAQEIIDHIDSYTEVSPSGTGIRIIVRAKLPPGGRKKGRIEMYDAGRFVTITGEHLDGTPTTVEDRQQAVEGLHARTFGRARVRGVRLSSQAAALVVKDDARMIKRLEVSKNGVGQLWRGDSSAYASSSEADLALAGHLSRATGGDRGRTDRLFRQSGLMRPKWDERHFADGRTYGEATLDRVQDAGSPTTDAANAHRFALQHGDDLLYCKPWQRWLCWDGRRWRPDDTGTPERCALATARAIYAEAASEDDSERRKALSAWARQSESAPRLEAMLKLARALLPVVPAQLDAEPLALSVQNGTVDLRTGGLRPHRREDLFTKLAPVEYEAGARAPTWEQFMLDVMKGRRDLVAYAQRLVGCALCGEVLDHVLPILHGPGENGKSTFGEVLLHVLGDYATTAAPGLLLHARGERHPTELADLKGARFVWSVEIEEGRRLREALVKQLTGGDTVKGRRMHQDFEAFAPTYTVFLAVNHRPEVRDTSRAMWRRVRLLPFEAVFSGKRRDPHMKEKLLAEAPGILAWAVRGCLTWQREGLGATPAEVKQATADYRRESDALGRFLAERCVRDESKRVTAKGLREAFARWADGEGEEPMAPNVLGERLRAKGFEPCTVGNVRSWKGLALR